MAKPITVSIVGNAGPLKKAVGEAEGSLDKLGGAFKKIGIATAAGFAAVGAGAAIAISRASDLNETISKVSVVFGEANKSVEKFANDAATKLGQTRQQALDASASFGIFGKAAGLSGENLATFSTDFTSLASDLASFNNTSPEQAINAIGAALRGESEPLRGYGVLLNDATLKTAALELGIYSGSGALTAQQKILAAQKVIYEQTGDAQGDFERTSDGLANSQKILSAQLQNVVTDIGSALLPIALKLATVFSTVLTPSIAFINEKVLPILTEKFTDVGNFITDRLLPTFLSIVRFIKDELVPTVLNFAIPIFESVKKVFGIVSEEVNKNRDTFIRLGEFLKTLFFFIKENIIPIIGTSLKIAFEVIGKIIPPVISAISRLIDIFTAVATVVIKVASTVLDTIETMINGIIKGVNFAIETLNRLPGVDIGLVGNVSVALPTITAPTVSGGAGSSFTPADRLPSPAFNAPSVNLPAPELPSGGGGGGSFGETGSTPAQIQAAIRASGGTTSALTTFGMAERIAAMESSRANQAAPVNITVNTVTADANLPNLIVESLQRYNLISGPVDVQIAI
jgi:phage-related protein